MYTDKKTGELKPFKNQFNATENYEPLNTDPSLTIPGQTMSIQDMFERVKFGEKINLDNRLYYEQDEDGNPLPKIKDLTDIDDIKNNIKNVKEKAAKFKAEKEKQLEIIKATKDAANQPT